MIEDNIGIIRKVVLNFVHHWQAINDSWQYAVAYEAVCEATPKWQIEKGKFPTFIHSVSYLAIIREWNNRKRKPTFVPIGDADFEIPVDNKLALDVSYDELFEKMQNPDADMYRRYIEGEKVVDIVKSLGISRQSFYDKTKNVKASLAKQMKGI